MSQGCKCPYKATFFGVNPIRKFTPFMLAVTHQIPTRAVQSYKKFALKLTFRIARYPDKTLGQKIKKLRLERGLKQVELGQFLGVSEDTLRNWEKGRTVHGMMLLRRIEAIFGKNFL